MYASLFWRQVGVFFGLSCYALGMLFFRKARLVYTLLLCGVAVGGVLMGVGCGPLTIESAGEPAVPSVPTPGDQGMGSGGEQAPRLTRTSLVGGIEHVSYSFSTSSEVRLELYGFPQDAYRFRLAAQPDGQLLSEWREETSSDVVAGINAMYFLEDFSPAGFFVAEGITQRAHPFDWDLSALLVIDEGGALTIRPTTQEPEDIAELTHAAQSYPLLVLNGDPILETDSGKTSRRSLVGVDEDGMVWIGVVRDGDVSLYALGRVLSDMDIPWKQVLNLDGGSSSGLFVNGDSSVMYPSFKPVPSVLLVEER